MGAQGFIIERYHPGWEKALGFQASRRNKMNSNLNHISHSMDMDGETRIRLQEGESGSRKMGWKEMKTIKKLPNTGSCWIRRY